MSAAAEPERDIVPGRARWGGELARRGDAHRDRQTDYLSALLLARPGRGGRPHGRRKPPGHFGRSDQRAFRAGGGGHGRPLASSQRRTVASDRAGGQGGQVLSNLNARTLLLLAFWCGTADQTPPPSSSTPLLPRCDQSTKVPDLILVSFKLSNWKRLRLQL